LGTIVGFLGYNARLHIQGLVAAVRKQKAVLISAKQVKEYVLSDLVKVAVAVYCPLYVQLGFAAVGNVGSLVQYAVKPLFRKGYKYLFGRNKIVKLAGTSAPTVVGKGTVIAFQRLSPMLYHYARAYVVSVPQIQKGLPAQGNTGGCRGIVKITVAVCMFWEDIFRRA